MADIDLDPESDAEAVYDVYLTRRPPNSLRTRFPSMIVRSVKAQTAFRQRVEEPHEVADLLDKLFSVGLVLTTLHRVPTTAGPATYEVRVAGELGEPLLRYLRWFHYTVPERTLVQLTAGPDALLWFLGSCTDSGAVIERVRRVHTAPARAKALQASTA